ncbi:MAG: threonine/serine exporter family protein [Oscillospiraceae bacterium]
MDCYLLADMTVQIGYELAIAGAETYRVEETMRRVIEAYGTEGQAFAIPNCVAVSFVAQNTKPLTIMKRVGYHGNDLERIEKLNALSRRICAGCRSWPASSAGRRSPEPSMKQQTPGTSVPEVSSLYRRPCMKPSMAVAWMSPPMTRLR